MFLNKPSKETDEIYLKLNTKSHLNLLIGSIDWDIVGNKNFISAEFLNEFFESIKKSIDE